jgi:glycosyltransferase involved in cell wall biosynthesis
MLADSFPNGSWKERLKCYLTVHYLNAPSIQRIGNHGRSASTQLVTKGVDKHKVFAWDYPNLDTPEKRPPKNGPAGQHLIYVGMLSASKGVDDLIHGLALARRTLPHLTLDIIGQGDTDRLQRLVNDLRLEGVNFVGPVPNNSIVQRMADADAVVIPSRHDYSEGLPLTIYEAFCSRTPLILSDHPMFLENVTNKHSGLMFKGSDPVGLSAAIVRLFEDSQLYEALSTNSLQAWKRLQISQTWAEAIDQWLRGDVIAKG